MYNLTSFLDVINQGIDRLVPILCTLALAMILIRYTSSRIRRDGFMGGVYMGVVALLEEVLLVLAIWFFPQWMATATHGAFSSQVFRWIVLYLFLTPLAYFLSKKHGGWRGLIAMLVILSISLLGWLMDHWIGFVAVSLPLFGILTFMLYHLAQVVIPASELENGQERRQKFMAYLWYMLGLQYPFWVVKGPASREIDLRIPGEHFRDFGRPGIVWMRPHQAVGMSMGIEFNHVDGPGVLFTGQYERPIAAVDLRTQLRSTDVKTVTKNGMPVTVVVFTIFAIDREDWPNDRVPRAEVNRIGQVNPLLQGGTKLDKRTESFPYSTIRIKAVLSTVGVNAGQQEGDRFVYWDEWVVKQVEHAVRQLISGRSLDELWRPKTDKLNASASDEMANRLKEMLEKPLHEVGIRLFGARIVDYKFDTKSEIPKQQIATWQTFWSQRITAARADADARSKEEIEKAHAYAKSVLLDAIADSIKKAAADKNNPDLPRHVIAMYFIHALEEYEQKELTDAETKKRLESIKDFLLYNRTEGK